MTDRMEYRPPLVLVIVPTGGPLENGAIMLTMQRIPGSYLRRLTVLIEIVSVADVHFFKTRYTESSISASLVSQKSKET